MRQGRIICENMINKDMRPIVAFIALLCTALLSPAVSWSDGNRTFHLEYYVYQTDLRGTKFVVVPIPTDTISGICPWKSIKTESLCDDCGSTLTWRLFGQGQIRLDASQMSSKSSLQPDTAKFEIINLDNGRKSVVLRFRGFDKQPLNRIDALDAQTDISSWNIPPEYIKLATYILENTRILDKDGLTRFLKQKRH